MPKDQSSNATILPTAEASIAPPVQGLYITVNSSWLQASGQTEMETGPFNRAEIEVIKGL